MKKIENNNLVKKIAWSFHQTTGIEFNELLSEAYVAYCEAMKSYNPKRSRITTHLWHCITSHLINFIKVEQKYHNHLVPFSKLQTNDNNDNNLNDEQMPVEKEVDFSQSQNDFYEKLTFQAQEVLKTIVENQTLLLSLKKEEIMKTIMAIMLQRGMRKKNVWIGIKDLKQIFKS